LRESCDCHAKKAVKGPKVGVIVIVDEGGVKINSWEMAIIEDLQGRDYVRGQR